MGTAGNVEGGAGPRVAVLGTFDVDNYGDHLFPEIARAELGRRLPGAAVDAFSPYGWLHPTRLDGPVPVEPLGPWGPAQARRLAAAYDCVVVGGGELVHLNDPLLAAVYGRSPAELEAMAPSRWFVEAVGADLEPSTPVVWHGIGVPVEADPGQARRLRCALSGRRRVTVRDAGSAARLRRAGVEGDVEVVPDSALLVDRLLPAADLAGRLDRLRRSGAYPAGRALVLQGCDLVTDHAPRLVGEVAAALVPHPDVGIVLVETGLCRGDAGFADAVEAHSAGPVHRLAPSSPLADVAAALAGASVFVGSSLHGAITSLAHGRPFVLVDLAGEPKLAGFAAQTGTETSLATEVSAVGPMLSARLSAGFAPTPATDLQARVDGHFDAVAAIAAEAAAGRPRGPRPAARDVGAAGVRAYVDLVAGGA